MLPLPILGTFGKIINQISYTNTSTIQIYPVPTVPDFWIGFQMNIDLETFCYPHHQPSVLQSKDRYM